MKFRWILVSFLLIGILLVPCQSITPNLLHLQQAHASSNANLFVSAENSQYNNYFAGPQVIQVVVSDPDINRLDQAYGEPTVTVNGKKLRMAQATDGNWYAYFADRNQAIAADKTSGLAGKGLDFGQFCSSTSSVTPSLTETKGFTVARAVSGSVDKPANSTAFGVCTDLLTSGGAALEHVVRENKTLTAAGTGPGVTLGQLGFSDSNVWPIIQLYDFSAIPTPVTIDYQKAGGDQIVNLTFDRIPTNLVTSSLDKIVYFPNAPVFFTINDPQLNIDPTEDDSWTWGSNPANYTLYYEAFNRNGAADADGTAGMQNLIGNLTTFMFNHNGRLTINPQASGTRIIDFQSNLKQILVPSRGDAAVVHTLSISSGSQPITFIETGGVNTGVFRNGDGQNVANAVITNSNSINGQNATVTYNDVSQNIPVLFESAVGPLPTNTSQYTLFLRSTHFTPTPGLNIAAIKNGHTIGDIVHFLLQFTNIPSVSDKTDLGNRGIRLTDYVTGNTYIASANFTDLDNLNKTAVPNAKWAGPLSADLKTSPLLNTANLNNIPKWGILNATHAVVTVFFNKDTNMTDNLHKIHHIGRIIANNTIIPSATVLVDFKKINDIAQLDSVQFVDVVDPPLVNVNDFVRNATNVEILHQNPSYDLKGDGVTAMVYDAGPISNDQPDLDSRVMFREDPNDLSWNPHATHVAGILGGDGRNSAGMDANGVSNNGMPLQWIGMAPDVNLLSFWFNPTPPVASSILGTNTTPLFNDGGDMINDFNQALNDQRVVPHPDLASMSLGTNAAKLNPPVPSYFGVYSATSILVDDIVTGSAFNPTHPLIFFIAAGNNREGEHISSPYGTTDPPGTAKDSIAVGAVMSNDYSMTTFSSWGPTNDARLKPDIVAPGSGPNMVKSTGLHRDYMTMQGTSQATPAAAGAAALLIQEWKSKHLGVIPLPHTVKAILIHTATELGDKIGPDYRFGFGALNARFAIDLVKDDANLKNALIHTDSINLGATQSVRFDSDGQDDVKATLVWDDPSGAPISGGLKNDLDLQLQDPNGIAYNPLVLDPTKPLEPAKQGVDNKNNVEMAIGNKVSGTWTATITGKSITTGNSQDYTVIISKVYKRTTSTSLTADIHGGTGTVIAVVSDTDSGTPVPVKGIVSFTDGHDGVFSNQQCVHQGSNLVCSSDYTQKSWLVDHINANYLGDPAHKESSNSLTIVNEIYCHLMIIVPIIMIIVLIIILGIAAVILYERLL